MGSNFNIPNALTLSRVLLVPLVIYSYHAGHITTCLSLLLFSLITDYLDGASARWFKQQTDLGALLDPLADKFVVISYMLLFICEDIMPLWFVVIVLLRNISQFMAVPILMSWLKIPFKVKPKLMPKFATMLSFAIVFLCFFDQLSSDTYVQFNSYFLLALLMPLSALMEAHIFLTFTARFRQIVKRNHDTFE